MKDTSKKYLPIILPIVALIVVAILGWRWYRGHEDSELETPEVAAGVEVTPKTSSDEQTLADLRRGVGDYQTTNLQASGRDAYGEVRYQFQDGKALFSVNANLPTDDGQQYHVYVKQADSETFRDLGSLEYSKGGLIASDAISTDKLPLVVEIRRGEEVVLTGTIAAPESPDESPLDNPGDQE